MTERRRKIKQARTVEILTALAAVASGVLRLFVIPDSVQGLRMLVSIAGSAALVCALLFGWRRKNLICCPHCGVLLRDELIDSPQFTCLGCSKEVDNSNVSLKGIL